MHPCARFGLHPLLAHTQANAALAPLRCEARFRSSVRAISKWVVRLEQYVRPLPPLAPHATHSAEGVTQTHVCVHSGTNVYRCGRDGRTRAVAYAQQAHGNPSTEHSGTSSGSGGGGGGSSGSGSARLEPLLSVLLECEEVVTNRQSVWLRFELPQWVKTAEGGAPAGSPWNVSCAGPSGNAALARCCCYCL